MTGTDQAEDKRSKVVGTDTVVHEELVRGPANAILKGWRKKSWEVGGKPERAAILAGRKHPRRGQVKIPGNECYQGRAVP